MRRNRVEVKDVVSYVRTLTKTQFRQFNHLTRCWGVAYFNKVPYDVYTWEGSDRYKTWRDKKFNFDSDIPF